MYEYFIGPNGVFNTPLAAVLFTVLQFGFMATESRRRRAAPTDATRAVTKAFPPLFLALMVGLFARLLCGFLKIGVIRGDVRDAIVVLGFILAIGGWLLRVWAQQHTGKFFVGEVAVQRDHQVIQTGPYKWVRHPAYTGGVLRSCLQSAFSVSFRAIARNPCDGFQPIFVNRMPRVARHDGQFGALKTVSKRFSEWSEPG